MKNQGNDIDLIQLNTNPVGYENFFLEFIPTPHNYITIVQQSYGEVDQREFIIMKDMTDFVYLLADIRDMGLLPLVLVNVFMIRMLVSTIRRVNRTNYNVELYPRLARSRSLNRNNAS